LFLSTSLVCLAVVRPPLTSRFFSRYTSYRFPKRNYVSPAEEPSAIANKIANQEKVIEQIKQRQAEPRWSDRITWLKNLRKKNDERKLQKADLKRKALIEEQEASLRNLSIIKHKEGGKSLEQMINTFRKK
jgi:hypothetical protein